MSVEQLLFIMDDEELCRVYEEYLAQNMATENLAFYREVEKFKNTNQVDLGDHANAIYETYIQCDAEFELGDLDLQTRRKIEASLHNPTQQMFDSLADTVLNTLVNATVNDFLVDISYINYITKQFAGCSHVEIKEKNTMFGPLKSSVFSCMLWGTRS